VAQVMRKPTESLPAEMTVMESLASTRGSEFQSWLVTDAAGLRGIVNKARLEQWLADGAGSKRLAELLDAHTFPHVHTDQSLHLALERMGAAGLDILPVVSRANVRVLEGVIALRDVLGAYGVGAGLSYRHQEIPPAPQGQP
jgi:CBS domain-containing protein